MGTIDLVKYKALRKIDKSEYTEYLKYARGCIANRVYPLSIATGTQDGDIYVDGKGCVMFWHYCGFAYISGDVSADILDEVYRDFLASDMERRLLLITDSDFVSGYYSGIDSLLVDKRIEYTHSGNLEKQPELDECFAIERITSDNIGIIQGRITPAFSWKDSYAFLQNGFGFMARNKEDGSFAAVAFSSAVGLEEVDIGVETAETYRHHGLASCLAYKMCEEIIQQGRRHHGQNKELMKILIRNTYRVLASRGEKGCFIYSCDENLQRYLGTVIPTLHVEVPDDYMVYPLGEERQAAENVGMHGRVTNVYDRGTAQIRDDAGNTYGVSDRNGRGLHVGDEVSFVPSPDGRYANNVVVINM